MANPCRPNRDWLEGFLRLGRSVWSRFNLFSDHEPDDNHATRHVKETSKAGAYEEVIRRPVVLAS